MSEAQRDPAAASTATPDERWARELIGRVTFAALIEQRRARRWGIFFKFLFLIYLVALLALYLPAPWGESAAMGEQHTAVVRLEGAIALGEDANADDLIAGLEEAFESESAAGVILSINSPGGSPVQSGLIYDAIRRLRAEYPDKPLYAVVEDICASGGYYVAAAAERIYANQASVVGSIGVRAGGFGFVEVLDKLGVERRLYTAGEHKAFLDPFSPARPEDVNHMRSLLESIHAQFITAVREGRGERLQERPELFSGLVWTGHQGLELGLVDGLADKRQVAEEIIGAPELVDYTRRPKVLERILQRVETTLARAATRALGLDASPLR